MNASGAVFDLRRTVFVAVKINCLFGVDRKIGLT
jgi:hypothetical protein